MSSDLITKEPQEEFSWRTEPAGLQEHDGPAEIEDDFIELLAEMRLR